MTQLRLGLPLAVLLFAGLSCDHAHEEACPDDDHDRAAVIAADRDPVRDGAGEHGAESCGTEIEFGPPTASACPPDSTLTYESFGKGFMESYCTRCHSSTLTGDARNGASLYHDFDSLDGVLAVADHVDAKAAAGPGATNELMPIGGPTPTVEERKQLGEWLACELAKM